MRNLFISGLIPRGLFLKDLAIFFSLEQKKILRSSIVKNFLIKKSQFKNLVLLLCNPKIVCLQMSYFNFTNFSVVR